jgi:hypothetical protein
VSHAQFFLPTTLTASGFFVHSGFMGKESTFNFHLGDALAVISINPMAPVPSSELNIE